MEGEKHR